MSQRQLDMDKCFYCGDSKKEAKRPFWGFNHCSKSCHKSWAMITAALWEPDEAKKHEAIQKLRDWEEEGLIVVPARHAVEWELVKERYPKEENEAFWLKHRTEHESLLTYTALRATKKTKSFVRRTGQIAKELERATENLRQLRKEKAG